MTTKSILIVTCLLGLAPSLMSQEQEEAVYDGYLQSRMSLQKRLGHHLGGAISIKHKAWDIYFNAEHQKHTENYEQVYRSLPPLASGHKAVDWVANTDKAHQAYKLHSTLGYEIDKSQKLSLFLLYKKQYEDSLWADAEAEDALGSSLLPSYRAKYSNTLRSPMKQQGLGLSYTAECSKAWQFEAELEYLNLAFDKRNHSIISPYAMPSSTREQEGLYSDRIGTLSGNGLLTYRHDKSQLALSYDLNYRNEELDYSQSSPSYQSLLLPSQKHHKAEEHKLGLSWEQGWGEYFSSRIALGLRGERRSWVDIGGSSMLDLLPSLELSYKREKWRLKLAYRKEIEMPKLDDYDPRPYYMHEVWIRYNDISLPSLRREELKAELSYGALELELSYGWLKNAALLDFRSSSLGRDPLISYYTTTNLSHYALGLSYRTQLGVWQSDYSLQLKGQSFRYADRLLNKPTWELGWRNTLSLGKGWELQAKVLGILGGHELNQRLGDYYQIDLGISKQIGKRLRLSLEVEDLTTTGQEERWTYSPKATLYSLNNSDYASYSLTLRYTFGAFK